MIQLDNNLKEQLDYQQGQIIDSNENDGIAKWLLKNFK